MYGWAGEIVRTAVESVPEEILENEKVREALEYLGSWIDQYSDYIEPNGDEYNDIVADAERDGAEKVQSRVVEILQEAEYRQRMFGTTVELSDLIRRVEHDLETA
jgi:hypothetical protein